MADSTLSRGGLHPPRDFPSNLPDRVSGHYGWMPRADATEWLRRNRLTLPRSDAGAGGFSLPRDKKSLHFFGELPSGGPGLSNAKIARLLLPGDPNRFFGRDTRICLHEQVSYPTPVIRPVANLRTRLGNSVRRSRGNNVTHYNVGISPKAPPNKGRRPSRETLQSRLRYHMRGNAEGSTLRLTLGCLLSKRLGIELRRVGSGWRLTFCDGEQRLSEWLGDNAFVSWKTCSEPWLLEEQLIRYVPLPLNLDQNGRHPFHPILSSVRRMARDAARQASIWHPRTS